MTFRQWGAALIWIAAAWSCGQDDTGTKFRCGDGIVTEGEQCDGTNYNNQTCRLLGLGDGSLACMTNCTYDTSGCESSGTQDDAFEPNDSPAQAKSITLPFQQSGLVLTKVSPRDYFQVELNLNQEVVIEVQAPYFKGDVDLSLYEYDGANATEVASDGGEDDTETITYTPAGGETTHLILVDFIDSQDSTTYNLSVSQN